MSLNGEKSKSMEKSDCIKIGSSIEAIIPNDLFEKVQKIMEEKRQYR